MPGQGNSGFWNWCSQMIPGQTTVIREIQTMPLRGHHFTRIAGISGGVAIILGAYGAHGLRQREADPKQINAFDTGSRYHLIHSLALLAAPLCRRPALVGLCLLSGMTLFCGGCYHYGLTGKDNLRRFTPYGGVLLILGWFAMAL